MVCVVGVAAYIIGLYIIEINWLAVSSRIFIYHLFCFTRKYLMYKKHFRSESMASVYSQGEGRYGTVTVKGDLEFGFIYNMVSGSLDINIKQCRDLAAVDTKRNRSDP